MTTTQIEKILELINKNDIINAKQLLQIELLKNSNNKNVKLIDVIKKYFNKMDNSRPVLKTIMIKNNKQFICNGYSMYIFESYIDELDILPQSTDNVLDYTQIIIKGANYQNIDNYDLKILKNINKIVNYYKQIDGIDKKGQFIIPFANKFYDAKMILELVNIYQNNFDNLKMYKTNDPLQLTQLTNNNITSIIMPVRIVNDDEKKLYNDRINSIFSLLEDYHEQNN